MALLLRASGCVVINSMIDGFNASRMGCPERQNRTENIYFPVAWNRAELITPPEWFFLLILVVISAPWTEGGDLRDLLEVVNWMDRVFTYMCSKYSLRVDVGYCARHWG